MKVTSNAIEKIHVSSIQWNAASLNIYVKQRLLLLWPESLLTITLQMHSPGKDGA